MAMEAKTAAAITVATMAMAGPVFSVNMTNLETSVEKIPSLVMISTTMVDLVQIKIIRLKGSIVRATIFSKWNVLRNKLFKSFLVLK